MKIQRNYLIETKQDIEKFVNKFGQETYDLFNKSRDRLKNNGYSTDIIYYTNKVSKEELDDILSKLQRRLKTTNDDGDRSEEGIRGKYKYLGEKDGYKVYQPLDYLASVDLGYMSGWCTTGRYGHAGERDCKPSESEAKSHFEEYISQGIKLYYFLDSKTMEGEYAIALYPETLEVNQFINDELYIESVNFEIYNQNDEIDYSVIKKLPIDLVPRLEIESQQAENGLIIDGTKLIKAKKDIKKVEIPNSITSIGEYAFYECKNLKSITFGENSQLEIIGSSAFRFCNGLESIVIPDSVKRIDSIAFSNCKNLKSIIFGNDSKLTSIGSYVFSSCISLESIEIPSSVTSIGDGVFASCRSLKEIIFKGNSQLTNISNEIFYSCGSLVSITIPANVTSIGNYAFRECRKLESISLKKNNQLTAIGYYAFLECYKLTSIEIPSSVTYIGDGAFYRCLNPTIYCPKGSYAEEYAKENDIPYKTTLTESYIKEDKAKENLNPKLWQNNELKLTIRQKIEEIVSKFIKGLEELKIALKIEDIRIVGSNASYNYTEDSDLDIHIVVDLNEYSEEQRNLIKLIFDYYKSSFNDKYEIYIKGIPVELYIEDQSNTSVSNGIYSVYKDEWLKFPEIIEKKDIDIKKQFDYVLNQYKKIRREQDKTEAQKLLDTLYFNRKMSLALEGEYGVDNLVFKKFRACGYLEELKKFIKSEESKELSLENLTNEWKKSIV